MGNANGTQNGVFIPTTDVWDIAQIESMDTNSDDFKEFIVRLYQRTNDIALALNMKDTGVYNVSEFVNGQLFFPNPLNNSSTAEQPQERQVFRKVVSMGTLSNAGATTVAHNITITPAITFTRIYATASNTTGSLYIPIPNVGTLQASMLVNNTNVVITTTVNLSAYTFCYAVLEWIKQ